MVTTDAIRAFYDDLTVLVINERLYDNLRHLKIFRFIDRIFAIKRANTVLDVGCGIGIISEHLRKRAPQVYGIDISTNNIRFASLTVRDVNFLCADFLQANLNQQFDLITLFDTLEHFPKSLHPQVFEKIRECSKEDTLVAITIPDPDFLDYYRQNFPEEIQVVDESIQFEELLSLLRTVNLEIMMYERLGIDFENQYRFFLLNYRKERFVLETKTGSGWFAILPEKLMYHLRAELRKLKYGKILSEFHR